MRAIRGCVLPRMAAWPEIPSPYVGIDLIPASNADELLEKLKHVEQTYDAAVVWVDAYAKGDKLGRSVSVSVGSGSAIRRALAGLGVDCPEACIGKDDDCDGETDEGC